MGLLPEHKEYQSGKPGEKFPDKPIFFGDIDLYARETAVQVYENSSLNPDRASICGIPVFEDQELFSDTLKLDIPDQKKKIVLARHMENTRGVVNTSAIVRHRNLLRSPYEDQYQNIRLLLGGTIIRKMIDFYAKFEGMLMELTQRLSEGKFQAVATYQGVPNHETMAFI